MNFWPASHIRAEDEAAVLHLWRACNLVVAQNDPLKDIQRKTTFQPDLFLVGLESGRIVATVMAGYERHRGWLNYLSATSTGRGWMIRNGIGGDDA